ncbi:hypothetical protein HYH02_009213 [Chlamydomonas schloesseri]|uniref:DNA polymerase n=1 Tax=Chlamydomonas schloesseri TaxID=2026947 RepID=A0A835WAW5_9CHLO|nr:hypothetical protein HYH02_009213 [Chlamydomonas schloesseri]|eukprot:KAG2444014.1 hypothetical protein HYH02_009213 [Chlamydomonas schloesseri]
MERSRRQPVQNSAAAKAKGALEQLRAAREGGLKRALAYEVKAEEAVYDVVDEQQYAEIVKKRRDAGDFVVDDDGAGYHDIGEDDYFQERPDEEDAEEEEEDAKQAGKKRKKEQGKRGKDGEAGGNIGSMFRKAAAARAIPGIGGRGGAGGSGPKPTDAAADEMLDNILGDILADAGVPGAVKPAAPPLPYAAPAPVVARPMVPPAAAAMRGVGAVAPMAVPRPFGGMPARPVSGLAAVAALTASGRGASAATTAVTPSGAIKREPMAQAAAAAAPGPVADAAAAADVDDGDMHMNDAADGGGADDMDIGGVAAATAGVKQEDVEVDVKLPPPSAASAGGAGAAAGGKPAGRNFMDAPATPLDGAAVQRAEDVWDEMYGGTAGDDAAAAAAPVEAPSPAPVATTPGGGDAASGAAPLPLDSNGMLPFYCLDAYENPDARPGEVMLFGKIEAEGGRWQSCAVAVRGLQRTLIVVPRRDVFEDGDGAIAALHAVVKADPARKPELMKMLQERCGPLRDEVRALLTKAGVGAMRMVPVRRSYAFESREVPHGEQWVIKVRYPGHMPALQLPASGSFSGKTYCAIFGANQSTLESLSLKRRIKGPGWMGVLNPTRVEYGNQTTWCKVEVAVEGGKRLLTADKGLAPDAAGRAPPPLTVASLCLKTSIHPTSHQHEIVAASVVHLSGVSPDAPLAAKDWSNPQRLRSFSIVRRLDGQGWPAGMEAAAAAENATPRGRANSGPANANGPLVALQASERSLLTCLLARLQSLDADVLVGHNVAAFDLTTLLSRMQHHKVPLWSRIGRVKKTEFPRLTGGGHTFGGGAGAGVMATVAGRLMCDTYMSARELVKSVDYTLGTLAQSLLGQSRSDPLAGSNAGNNSGLGACFASAEGVLRLLRHGESDAWLALGIMFHLSVLPLTKQLSVLSGQLWSRTLAGQRAARIEMLLLHEFHGRKFIVPDKQSYKDKQRRAAAEAEEDFDAGGGGDDEDGEGGGGKGKKGKGGKGAAAAAAAAPSGNGPKYAGGLVLEPKKGLYDKVVIILDFNSLYPSIIQEYNICFTTVQRPEDGSLPPLPDPATAANGLAPLPAVLQALVNRRRQVKAAMANERNPVTRQQLQVRQQAIKLTANSMYGCLGFGASRFYAQPLAELITAQGRSILSSTVDLVQGAIGAEVIYGDTDSIMVATRSDSVEEARALGARIKREVNKRYKLLEIELDGVFKSILLLKKKKYAAVKLEPNGQGGLAEVMEQKGLDIVRRDWCPLSKDVGNFALAAVLSGRGREEVVGEIHAHLRQVAEKVRAGQIPMGKFIITKQLTKRPEDYPDAKNQPHVQVALRRRAAGKRDGVLPGETVPYIICVERDPAAAAAAASTDGASGGAAATAPAAAACAGGLADRARHPEELREQSNLAVDVEYYLAQQIHPVVSRLVSPIEGTDAAHIADCLGLDPARYRGAAGGGGGGGLGGGGEDEDAALLMGSSGGTLMDEDDNFRSCAPLLLTSPSGASFPLRGVDEVLRGAVLPDQLLTPPDALGDPSAAVSPAALINQVLLRAREAVARYYDGVLRPDDETADAGPGGCRAAVLRPAAAGGEEAGAGGGGVGPERCAHPDPSRQGVLLRRAMNERDLYLQLSHYYRLLHVEGAVRRHHCRLRAADPKSGVSVEDVRALVPEPLARALGAAAEALDGLRRRSHWHWVDLGKLFGSLHAAAAAAPAATAAAAAAAVAASGVQQGQAQGTPGGMGGVTFGAVRGAVG